VSIGYIAPAGTPIAARDLLAGLVRAGSGLKSIAALEREVTRLTGTSHAWTFSSGRAAMVTALGAMSRACADPRRTEVFIPAYTCYTVAAAIVRAGLKPRLYDLDPHTLDPILAGIAGFDAARVLAIVATSLYGAPTALTQCESFARTHGIYLIDDAAQALGSLRDGRPVGGFGDAGIVSLEKGKNITTIQGGALVTRNATLLPHFEQAYRDVPAASPLATCVLGIKLLLYAALLRPWPYAVVRRLPGLNLGVTIYDEHFPITRYSSALAAFALVMGTRLNEFNRRRTSNGVRMEQALQAIPGVQLLKRAATAEPVHLRLPCFIDSRAARTRLLEALDRAGIGASVSYPNALCDVPEVRALLPAADRELPGARRIAESIVTLPTHPYCPDDLPARTAAIFAACGLDA
jgi:dTDP-4-amino-4,6-dideoxygalactose transaminase